MIVKLQKVTWPTQNIYCSIYRIVNPQLGCIIQEFIAFDWSGSIHLILPLWLSASAKITSNSHNIKCHFHFVLKSHKSGSEFFLFLISSVVALYCNVHSLLTNILYIYGLYGQVLCRCHLKKPFSIVNSF